MVALSRMEAMASITTGSSDQSVDSSPASTTSASLICSFWCLVDGAYGGLEILVRRLRIEEAEINNHGCGDDYRQPPVACDSCSSVYLPIVALSFHGSIRNTLSGIEKLVAS